MFWGWGAMAAEERLHDEISKDSKNASYEDFSN
jgi:hypothetical protein